MTFDVEEESRVAEKLYLNYGKQIKDEESFQRAYSAFMSKAKDGKGMTEKRIIWSQRVLTQYKKGKYMEKRKGGNKRIPTEVKEAFEAKEPKKYSYGEAIPEDISSYAIDPAGYSYLGISHKGSKKGIRKYAQKEVGQYRKTIKGQKKTIHFTRYRAKTGELVRITKERIRRRKK